MKSVADVFTTEKRSAVMALIRGKGNKNTELKLMGVFRTERIIGWRRNFRIFGRPDFVFPKLKLAIFVDGCFWHGCPTHSNLPVGNAEFWARKLNSNKLRDRTVNRRLRETGWKVLRIWEHELSRKNAGKLRRKLLRVIPRENEVRDRLKVL